MQRLFLVVVLSLSAFVVYAREPAQEAEADRITFAPTDWPWWRGPTRDGVAPAGQKPPLKWSDSEKVVWRSRIPGNGHGSPTIVGERIFLATADEKAESQSLLCFDRKTGKQLWQTEIHRGGFAKKMNTKSSHASSTPACDGKRVFINFLHDGAIYTTALNLQGKRLWQTRITGYVLHQGFGSSPALYRSLVLVSADNKGTGAIVALDRATGKEVWKQPRPKAPNYASPIVLNVAGRDQLVMTGCDLVAIFNPLTGKKLWEVEGSTTECVTSTVTDGRLVFTSGGYPKNHVSAVHADGSGKLAWENNTRVYVPSMVVHDGHLYAVLDDGFAICWKCDTGKQIWKHRLSDTFSASLVLVGEHLYATNERGRTVIFEATPKAYTKVGDNEIDRHVYATPAICGGQIFMRVTNPTKQGWKDGLYCLGTSKPASSR